MEEKEMQGFQYLVELLEGTKQHDVALKVDIIKKTNRLGNE